MGQEKTLCSLAKKSETDKSRSVGGFWHCSILVYGAKAGKIIELYLNKPYLPTEHHLQTLGGHSYL